MRKVVISLIILFVLMAGSGCTTTLPSLTEGEPVQVTPLPSPPPEQPTSLPTPLPDQPVSSDNPTPSPNNQAGPRDAGAYNYGEAVVDRLDILILESFPVQVNVVARGSLPDSCTTIDNASVERNGNTFQGRLTTRQPTDKMCAQALVPYEQTIPLDVTGLPPGEYTVNINGVTNTFTLPGSTEGREVTPPTATSLATLVPTSQPATPIPTPQPANQGGISRVKIYLVAMGDNGQSGQKIGCDDSLVPVEREITPTIAPLRAAINELLSLRQPYFGQSGLYNALYQSDLQVGDINLVNGKAVIHLSGQYALGGVCDTPRFKAQLEATALQFSTVKEVDIFINDQPLDEVLSLS